MLFLKLRPWFSFSLRALLVIVTIICLLLGWKMHGVQNLRRAIAEVQRLGGTVNYVHELNRSPPAEPPGPKWIRAILGNDFFVEIDQIQLYTDQADDETIRLISKLPSIRSLILKSNNVTDRGLAELAQANGLYALDLRSSKTTPAGYLKLKEAKTLASLICRDSSDFTDEWLPNLVQLTQVRYLTLNRVPTTDHGLEALYPAVWLKRIDLTGTQVTKKGVDELKKKLPHCRIVGP